MLFLQNTFISDCECKSDTELREVISHSDLCWQGYLCSFLSTWEPPETAYHTFTERINLERKIRENGNENTRANL